MVRQRLERLHQSGVIRLIMPQRSARIHKLRGTCGLWQRHAQRSRTLQREVQIFLVQRNPESRVECALDHALAVNFENAAGSEAPHQRLPDFSRISTGLRRKDKRLTDGCYVERYDDLVGDFAGLTVAIAADQCDVLAHQLE